MVLVCETSLTCEGCLVVRSGHGPQAEVAQGVGPKLLVEHWGEHLEGLEGERWNEVEDGDSRGENNQDETHKCTCMDGMTRARRT